MGEEWGRMGRAEVRGDLGYDRRWEAQQTAGASAIPTQEFKVHVGAGGGRVRRKREAVFGSGRGGRG